MGFQLPYQLVSLPDFSHQQYLGGGFKHFLFSSLFGGRFPIWLAHIFQMGWFNHQPGMKTIRHLKPAKTWLSTAMVFPSPTASPAWRKRNRTQKQAWQIPIIHTVFEGPPFIVGYVNLFLSYRYPYWDVLLVLRISGLFHPYISRLDTSPK